VEVIEKFEKIVDTFRAGDPMNEGVKFTYLSRAELLAKLLIVGVVASLYLVDKLLNKIGLSQRKMSKTGTHKQVEGRNEQFEYIEKLVTDYTERGQIVLAIDGKKKELLGQLYRPGKLYCNEAQKTNDHDFSTLSTGKVSPFGIYDKTLNEGYMFLGTSSETADFAVDCVYEYLKHYGKKRHPDAEDLLILCDSGGSNSYRSNRFKEMIQWVSDRTELKIRIAHYPSYCSKYNPCDHRLFPHVTRALSGVMLDSVQTMCDLIKSRAKTKTGLEVFVRQIKGEYKTKIKATKEFLNNYPVIHDTVLSHWNYWAIPNG
jgi:hypothetical protein